MHELVVFAHSTSSSNMLFSHHRQVLNALSRYFPSLVAVVHDADSQQYLDALVVSPWESNKRFRSLLLLLRTSMRILRESKPKYVFFLQTDLLAFLLSPFCKLLGIRSVLWYAHGHASLYLKIASRFVSCIVSPNSESITIASEKISITGHLIDDSLFPQKRFDLVDIKSQEFFHLGRCDRSKRMDLVFSVAQYFADELGGATLHLLGLPSNETESEWFKGVLKENLVEQSNLLVLHHGVIERAAIVDQLQQLGIFIHAFQGSLDKSTLETTLCLNPVATCNLGYIREFGSWSASQNLTDEAFLIAEIQAILNLSEIELRRELMRRRSIVLSSHSLQSWIPKIVSIIRNES